MYEDIPIGTKDKENLIRRISLRTCTLIREELNMPGYSKLAFDMISEKFNCTFCLLILREPKQNLCGHRFCKTCIDDMIRESGSYGCPICSTEDPSSEESILRIDTINPDFAIGREMRNLPTRCVNSGCDWSGRFIVYMEHEEICEHALIECFKQGCSQSLKRRDLQRHLEQECEMRIVLCQYCTARMVCKVLEIHLKNECLGVLVNCQFCNEGVLRGKLEEHINLRDGDCKRTRQLCKFNDLGCQEIVDKDRQDEHNTQSLHPHMEFLLQGVTNLQVAAGKHEGDRRTIGDMSLVVGEQGTAVGSLRHRVAELQDEIKGIQSQILQSSSTERREAPGRFDEMERRMDSLRNNITVLETKATTYEGTVALLNTETERTSSSIETADREVKRNWQLIEALERKIKAQDRIIALKDVSLAEQDLRIQSLEKTSYDGILTWKITDFERKTQDAISGRTTSLYSPPFFTSRFGYKMCARIYLNGDGIGKGNHVSLFFTIMKGEFDGILRWPFGQKVTFLWIDQYNQEHLVDAFRPDKSSSSFRRPTSEMNIASGCPLFMPLNTLRNGKHAYVEDDIAFLRIIVDTSDL
ncbi:TNF receptor-associated factor 2-like [Ptychodera flava]|uniref:TNF receptor-associated factor 2-like n=1 Tax=Ptychodera flava TaxID=63121 RepID=UPI00396AAEA1